MSFMLDLKLGNTRILTQGKAENMGGVKKRTSRRPQSLQDQATFLATMPASAAIEDDVICDVKGE